LDVGVALLLEYFGILMVVLWLWLRDGQRPRARTIAGSVFAIAGLILVLNLVGGGVEVNFIGVMWGLLSAVGLATHYLVAAKPAYGLPPLVLATGGLTLGAVGLWALSLTGVLPLRAAWVEVDLGGVEMPWWVSIGGVALISAAFAYVMGIGAVRVLGSMLASFVGLSEVLLAVLFAWLLLGQLPGWVQGLGGTLIIIGVVFVRADEAAGDGEMTQLADTEGAATV